MLHLTQSASTQTSNVGPIETTLDTTMDDDAQATRNSGQPAFPTPLSSIVMQQRLNRFDEIFIRHPRLTTFMTEAATLIDETKSRIAKNEKRLLEAKGRPIKLNELWLMPVIGPSGSGKSFSIETLIDTTYQDPNLGPDDIPILVVTLRSASRSPRQVQMQILEAYGAPQAAAVLRARDYSESRVNDDIRNIAREKHTTLVILDEVHNVFGDGVHVANKMAKAFKSLVNDGIFSLMLCGTSKALPLLTCDEELQSRQTEWLNFGPSLLTHDDLSYFFSFVALFEGQMLERQVIDGPIGLTHDVDACATVYDMSDGVIGIVPRILRLALKRAMRRGVTTPGWKDIGEAYRDWSFVQKTYGTDGKSVKKRDPFLKGPDVRTVDAIRRKIATDATGVH